MGKKYLLDLDTLSQMFCEEEGILAKFIDTSDLSIELWLEEKGNTHVKDHGHDIINLGHTPYMPPIGI